MLNSYYGVDGNNSMDFRFAEKKDTYLIDRMNSKFSYKYGNGKHVFDVTMKWRTEDENIVSAQYTDEFFLEWSQVEGTVYTLCEPIDDMSGLRKNTYTIKPGEDVEVNFDVDSYFNGLPRGYYRFVKVLDVKYKDGSVEQMIASFSCDLSE